VTAQETILRACQHPHSGQLNVNMGRGEMLSACVDCWNSSVTARREERKAQLAEHWRKYAEEQRQAMESVGAKVGQRVQYFCRSMLGFGGVTVNGVIALNRNGVPVIKLDQVVDGKKQAAWNKGWRAV